MSGLVYIVDDSTPDGRLFLSVLRNDIQEARLQVRDGADLNWRDPNWGHSPVHIASDKGTAEMLSFLIDAGADLEALDTNDMTPLMLACCRDDDNASACIRLLINAQANVNAIREGDQMTPLKFATRHLPAGEIQFLIDSGASVSLGAKDAQTPLMLAARNDNAGAVDVLVRAGADISAKCGLYWAEGQTAEQLAWLEKTDRAIDAFRKLRSEGLIE